MANYVTNVSDKSKRKAFWLCLLGNLGLHYFYVDRIGHGIFRFFLGSAMWLCWAVMATAPELADKPPVMPILIILITLKDLVKISLGKFQDNVGQYLRSK